MSSARRRRPRIETPPHRFTVAIDDPTRDDIRALMVEHLADMFATSPAESVHALDPDALADPAVTFFTAREGGVLLGCGALKDISPDEGEIKSMRTATAARGRGVASRVLAALLDEARRRGYRTVRLETGTQDFFAPARAMYRARGFVDSPPFGQYRLDPASVFLSLDLRHADD